MSVCSVIGRDTETIIETWDAFSVVQGLPVWVYGETL